MALKHMYEKREEIPAELAAHYVEKDGAFHLDADESAVVTEFRSSNVNLLKEIADWKRRFNGINPDEVRKLAAEKARLEEEQRLKDGKFDEVLASKLKGAVEPLKTELDAANARLSGLLIDQAVVAEATKRGVRPTALADVALRAKLVLRLVEGQPRVMNGDQIAMGPDGRTPMTLAEWVGALVTEAPHLFEANAGGGAAGSGAGGASAGGGGGGGVNPWDTATWNMTQQALLEKENPSLAARLSSSARKS